MLFEYIYRKYKHKFYDKLVEEFVMEIPDTVKEPALDFLAEKRVLFEKFLQIKAFYLQRERLNAKKGTEFYDGALMILKAFLVAVSKKAEMRDSLLLSKTDGDKQTKEQLDSINEFRKEIKK